jgi:ABC-type spermidine/putrescine transport system permease subunit II
MTNASTLSIVPGVPLLGILALVLLALYRRRQPDAAQGPGFVARNGAVVATFLVVAVVFWVIVLIVMPQLYMVDFSCHPKLPLSRRGGPDDVYTLQNYRYFLFGSTRSTARWNTTHIRAFFMTIGASVLVALGNFLLRDRAMVEGIRASLLIGLLVVLLAVPLGLAGTPMMTGIDAAVRPIHDVVVISPVLTPGVIIGISTVIFWRDVINVTGADRLYDGILLTTLGQATFISAYCMLIFLARQQRFDHTQQEAALDLGAMPFQMFRHILLPVLRPAIVSAAVIAFRSSFENYNTTTFAILADNTLTTVVGAVLHGIAKLAEERRAARHRAAAARASRASARPRYRAPPGRSCSARPEYTARPAQGRTPPRPARRRTSPAGRP